MAAPSITVVDTSDRTVTTWDNGTVQAQNYSAVLSIRVWNNRGGAVTLSDLKDVTVTALDTDGGATSDVVTGKWVQINCPRIDGNTTTYVAVGGSTVRYLQADGVARSEGYTIKGTANDGLASTTASKVNYSTANMRVYVPVNANPGTRNFKIRSNGWYT